MVNFYFLNYFIFMRIFLFLIILFFSCIQTAMSAEIQQINIVHINKIIEREPTIYSINPEIVDNGILGSRMGIKDNNTTGKFTNQNFKLIEKKIGSKESAKEIFETPGYDPASKAEAKRQLDLMDAGLPRFPAADNIKLNKKGDIEGLF